MSIHCKKKTKKIAFVKVVDEEKLNWLAAQTSHDFNFHLKENKMESNR